MMLDRQPLLDRAFAPSEVNGNIWSRPGKAIGSSECLLPAVGRLRPDSLLAAQLPPVWNAPKVDHLTNRSAIPKTAIHSVPDVGSFCRLTVRFIFRYAVSRASS